MIDTFKLGSETFMRPVAARFGMKFLRIAPDVFAMHNSTCAVKIYYPSSHHGHTVVVCLSPTFHPEWNSEGEIGLAWYLQFIGRSRHVPDSTSILSGGTFITLARTARLLTSVLRSFAAATPKEWTEFYQFFEQQASALRRVEPNQPSQPMPLKRHG